MAAPHGSVRLRVPASAANLGPGFDSLGLGLDLWDEVEASVTESGLVVRAEGEGAAEVPTDASHLVYRSMEAAWKRLDVAAPIGLKLLCHNEIPQSRGLGSSASAIVAGVAAAAALCGVDPSGDQGRAFVNDVAGDLEGHPDNSSASVFGGLTISWRDGEHWCTAPVETHPDVRAVLAVPQSRLATDVARAVLPEQVPHRDAARNSGRTALLAHAMSRRPDLLHPATRDWLHQEQRRSAYPASMDLVDRLRAYGHAATVSGAGPTVLVLTTVPRVDDVVRAATGPGWDVRSMPLASQGVSVVSHPAT